MAKEIGDRVRVDIPDKTDPDHQFHGSHGVIQDVIEDNAEEIVDKDEACRFRVELDSGEVFDVREWDVRPPFGDE